MTTSGDTPEQGKLLISLPGDSPVRISATPENKPELRASAPDYGRSSPVFLARYDLDTQSWRTSQRCLVETLADGFSEYLETWPRSGLAANGTAYQLAPLVRLTRGTACGLLHTPTKVANQMAPSMVNRDAGSWGMWPTPTASEGTGAQPNNGRTGGRSLRETVLYPTMTTKVHESLWPTPTVQDASNTAGPSQFKRNSLPLNAAAGGALSPMWVEWLMGYPEGWTDLEDSETP